MTDKLWKKTIWAMSFFIAGAVCLILSAYAVAVWQGGYIASSCDNFSVTTINGTQYYCVRVSHL